MVAATTQLGVQSWMFSNIPDMYAQDQKDGFTCPYTQVFGTASIIWGVVVRWQVKSDRFLALLYFFIVGAIAPAIPWLLIKGRPRSLVRYVKYVLHPSSSTKADCQHTVSQYFSMERTLYLRRRRLISYLKRWSATYSKISFEDIISPGGPSTTVSFPSCSCVLHPSMHLRRIIGRSRLWSSRVGISDIFTLQYPTNGMIGTGLQQWRGNTV
ncbi:hypothetical protein BKA83DRAFT_1190410 [Pisolithus microcarpus]|nr:hypothetical protein BKA83DRAFT_1190410 [Pisolithus microcarpus]